MTTSITLRSVKGSALTHDEMDTNLTNLQTTADDALAATETLTSDKAEAAALGVANTDQNMGSFTGSTISDNVSAKAAIQALETAVETKANASAVGVTSSAANMGTYTGTTIPDNETAKQNLQSLETAVEARPTSATLAATGGAALIGFIQAGADAVARTAQAKMRDFISVKDYGAIGDGVTDDTAAIQAALTYAGTLSISDASFSGFGYVVKGGATVYLPAGVYLTSSTLNIPQNVSLTGDGKHSSIIKSSYNGDILRNLATATVTGTYDRAGMSFRNFGIIGDRTKASQRGFSLLRWTAGVMENVHISKCGSHGLTMLQCGVNMINQVECVYNVGHGLFLAEGIEDWGGADNNLPSNANTFNFFRGLQNDGAGIYFGVGTNGNEFFSADCEYNYNSSGDNVGYNVFSQTDSNTPNVFRGLWTEGPVQTHVYVNNTDITIPLKLVDWKHFGNGAAGNVDRALIVNTGTAYVRNASATTSAYKTIAGSSAPFRIQNKATSIIRLEGCTGASATGIALVEDNTGAQTALFNNLKQDNGIIDGTEYGPRVLYNDGGAADGFGLRNDTDANAWLQSRAFYRDLLFGPGSSAADAGLTRIAAGQIGPRSGDFFNVGSQWDGSHLLMGSYHLWVDATGDLRIKSSAPTSDTDGTVVGTQT